MRTITVLANAAWIFLTVLFTLVFLALGILLIVFSFRDMSIDTALNQHKVLTVIIGFIMISLVAKYLVVMWLRTRREDCISFDNPDGEVIIAVHAVEDSVKRLVEGFSEVRSVAPSVTAVNDGVEVEVKVTLWDDSNVHAISESIQSAAKSHIQSYFGLANVNTVKVFISGTAARGGQSTARISMDDAEASDEENKAEPPKNG